MIVGAEECDDFNYSPGDGCSATCTVEIGFVCNGQPSVCGIRNTVGLTLKILYVGMVVLWAQRPAMTTTFKVEMVALLRVQWNQAILAQEFQAFAKQFVGMDLQSEMKPVMTAIELTEMGVHSSVALKLVGCVMELRVFAVTR